MYRPRRIKRQQFPIEGQAPLASPPNKFRIVQRRNCNWRRSDRYSPWATHRSIEGVAIDDRDAATFCYLSGRGAIT